MMKRFLAIGAVMAALGSAENADAQALSAGCTLITGANNTAGAGVPIFVLTNEPFFAGEEIVFEGIIGGGTFPDTITVELKAGATVVATTVVTFAAPSGIFDSIFVPADGVYSVEAVGALNFTEVDNFSCNPAPEPQSETGDDTSAADALRRARAERDAQRNTSNALRTQRNFVQGRTRTLGRASARAARA